MHFDIPALGPATYLTLGGITLLAAGLPLLLVRNRPARDRWQAALAAAALVLPCTAVLGWSLAHNSITLRDGQIVVRASLFYEYARNVADFDLARARQGSGSTIFPDGLGMRANGISLPGYAAGRFTGSDRKALFVAVTDREHMVYLPARSGQSLLVSIEQGQDLLEHLYRNATKEGAATGGRD